MLVEQHGASQQTKLSTAGSHNCNEVVGLLKNNSHSHAWITTLGCARGHSITASIQWQHSCLGSHQQKSYNQFHWTEALSAFCDSQSILRAPPFAERNLEPLGTMGSER